MRTKQEIKQAVAILCHKSDRLSLVQAEVLRGNMTEQQVFQKYVMEMAEDTRDETVFFAARDAAPVRRRTYRAGGTGAGCPDHDNDGFCGGRSFGNGG